MIKQILVGSHISIAGGLEKAFERGASIGCTAMQIFTKSNRKWIENPLTDDQIKAFKAAAKESEIKSIVVHAGYLINIASSTPRTAQESTKALLDEVRRCEELGLEYIIFHPGSHTGQGEEKGIEQVAKNLDYVLARSKGTVAILLETMAGQGTSIGHTFEQIKKMRSLCEHKSKIGYCLDTCHVFAAGYDIGTEEGYEKTIKDFDDLLGLEHLHAIHVNDSVKGCGDKRDRHAPLGDGKIPLKIFDLLMNDKRLKSIPKILETPSDDEMKLWAKEITLLKNMVKANESH